MNLKQNIMQAIGTYWGWVTPSYTITVSPEEVNDLLLALKCLQKLSGYKNRRGEAWLKLMESMNATDFGFDRIATDAYECTNVEESRPIVLKSLI